MNLIYNIILKILQSLKRFSHDVYLFFNKCPNDQIVMEKKELTTTTMQETWQNTNSKNKIKYQIVEIAK